MIYPVIPIQGLGWPDPIPAAQSTRGAPTLDRMPAHHRALTPPHSLRLGPWRLTASPTLNLTCTSLGCGRKSPQTWGERANSTQTRNECFFLIGVTTVLNEKALFEDPVFWWGYWLQMLLLKEPAGGYPGGVSLLTNAWELIIISITSINKQDFSKAQSN